MLRAQEAPLTGLIDQPPDDGFVSPQAAGV